MNVKSVSTLVLKTSEWDQEEMRRGLEQGKHFQKEEEVNEIINKILCTEVVFPLAQMATQHAHTLTLEEHVEMRGKNKENKNKLSLALNGLNNRREIHKRTVKLIQKNTRKAIK